MSNLELILESIKEHKWKKSYNLMKQAFLSLTYKLRRRYLMQTDRLRGSLEKAPYWKRACDPRLDVKVGAEHGYDL